MYQLPTCPPTYTPIGWLQARHFWSTWHTLEYIFGFLLMTSWLTPMLLVLSLAANEHTLPGGGTGMPSADGRSGRRDA